MTALDHINAARRIVRHEISVLDAKIREQVPQIRAIASGSNAELAGLARRWLEKVEVC